jgi:hypothetical protein
LDRGYDSGKTRDLLEIPGYDAHIVAKGVPAPIQAGHRWPVELSHSWMNGYGKLCRLTDKQKIIASSTSISPPRSPVGARNVAHVTRPADTRGAVRRVGRVVVGDGSRRLSGGGVAVGEWPG